MKDNTPLSEEDIKYLEENKRDKPAENLESEFITTYPIPDDVEDLYLSDITEERKQQIIDIINKNADKLLR